MKMNPNWYVAYTYPKAEKKVETRVREMGIDTYLPLQKVEKKWSDRVKIIEKPLFSNYIFIKTTEGNIPRLTDIYGIAKFISFQKRFATVREEEIDTIKKALKIGKEIQVHEGSFEEGKAVVIREGPFSGMKGAMIKKYGKTRFVIALEGLAKNIAVDIPINYLRTFR